MHCPSIPGLIITHTVVCESEDTELGFSTCLNAEPQIEIHGEAVNLSE